MIPPEVRKHVGNQILSIIKASGGVDERTASKIGQALQSAGCLKAISSHELSGMMVDALLKFRAAVRHYGRNRIHLRKDMVGPFQLSLDQVTNFSKLRMFGLAVHAEKGNSRSGYWLLTSRAGSFLRGESAVPRRVYTYQGHPIPTQKEEQMVWIDTYKDLLPELENFQRIEKAEPRPTARLAF